MKSLKVEKRIRRHKRIRSVVSGTATRPRISVTKSNTDLYVQAIDDVKGHTIMAISTKKISGGNKTEKSKKAGIEFGKKLLEAKLESGVFDRGGNIYTGRVAAFAEGLREAGLKI